MGADPASWSIFAAKAEVLPIWIDKLSTAGANILKQTALACGGDCAVHSGTVGGRVRYTSAILFLNRRQLKNLTDRLLQQPNCVAALVPQLIALDNAFHQQEFRMSVGGRTFDLGSRTYVMGVLNVTPDSFYDGGRYLEPKNAVEQAVKLEQEGADFLDVGAESTRPGAKPVPAREQISRLRPVLKELRRKVKIPLSIDTTNAEVARMALDAGCHMVNDISGFGFDPGMAKLVAVTGVPCVVMHMRGTPRTMQKNPRYRNLMQEIITRLKEAIDRAGQVGVKPEQIIVDPGIGFGKKLEHNLEILRRLTELRSLGRPILVGPSRKSFIAGVTGLEPQERLEGTLAAVVLAAQRGANIVRVHDVREAVRALRVVDAIEGKGR